MRHRQCEPTIKSMERYTKQESNDSKKDERYTDEVYPFVSDMAMAEGVLIQPYIE